MSEERSKAILQAYGLPERGPGRPKGSMNKTSKILKDVVLLVAAADGQPVFKDVRVKVGEDVITTTIVDPKTKKKKTKIVKTDRFAIAPTTALDWAR